MNDLNRYLFGDNSLIDLCILEDYLGLVFVSDNIFYTSDKIEYLFVDFSIQDISYDGFYSWKDIHWNSSVTTHISSNEYIVGDFKGSVWYHNLIRESSNEDLYSWTPPSDDIENIEDNISSNIGIGLKDLVNIDGTIFAPALQRRVYVRNGPSHWDEYNEPYFTPNTNNNKSKGFNSLDGFSKEDIYVCGGDKDLWHFNYTTKKWKFIDIGLKESFCCDTICCGEDGVVYIGGQGGRLVWGRDNTWKYIKFPSNQDIKKIISYQGRIYIGMEEGTYILKSIKDINGEDSFKLELYFFEGLPNFNGGHILYTAYNMMAVANYYNQIALYNGKKWINIYGCDDPIHFSNGNQKKVDFKRLAKIAKTYDKLSDNLKEKP